jgi:glycosyltransferase involved in cell wall biosynthesis
MAGACPTARSVASLKLLIVTPYFPPHVGGLEGYVSDLNEVLLRSDAVDAITVFTPWLPREGAAVEDRGAGYRVVRYPAFELIPNFPVPMLWKRGFWRALRSARPGGHDVLVSHTRFFLSSALALVCARAVSRPLLHVEHGSDYVQLDGRVARAAARAYDLSLGRLLLRHADAVVAVSHAAGEFVSRLASRDAVVIHRGMWTERLAVSVPDEDVLEWAAGRPLVSFVGRLIDGKGVPDLLHAFAALEGVTAVACVVGDGPRRGELESLAARLGISDRVLFLGYLPEGRAWSVVCASDIVVNPSYTEGLPTSVLEAALLGKAVLATDVGGTREIVTDGSGGLLVPPHDVEGLRVGLTRLLEDPDLRARLGHTAHAEAAGRFDWRESARRFIEVAEGLVCARAGQAGQTLDAAEEVASTSSNTDS